MAEALIRLKQGQPLDPETFTHGSQVPYTYTATDSKDQQQSYITVDIYWFAPSENAWYIKCSLPGDVKFGPGFHQDSYLSHRESQWHIDHGRHELNDFLAYVIYFESIILTPC